MREPGMMRETGEEREKMSKGISGRRRKVNTIMSGEKREKKKRRDKRMHGE